MEPATQNEARTKKASPFEQPAFVGRVRVHGVARTNPNFLGTFMTPLFRCANVAEVILNFYCLISFLFVFSKLCLILDCRNGCIN